MRKLAVRRASKDSRQCVQWSRPDDGKYYAKEIPCTAFGGTLFELLDWETDFKFRAYGRLLQNEGDSVFLFDLSEPEIFIQSYLMTGTDSPISGNGELSPLSVSGKRVRAVPKKLADRFGSDFYSHRLTSSSPELQSEDAWKLWLEGQLFETGEKLRVTKFDEMQRFIADLIGKQYELEKVARKHPPNINGFNQYKRRNKGERGDTFRRTAQKFSAQYNVSTGSVQKYAIFSKALDVVGQADPELPGKVLSGTFKISHENLVALSKMPPEEIRRIGSKPEDLQHPFTSYSDTRKEFADTDEEPVEPMQETLPLIKITPMHDPDAEIAGLTLTVPSWVSSIERARNNADMNAASTGAKSRLEEALLSLQEKVSEMLSDIREVD